MARRHGGQEGFVVDRLASGSGRAARRCRHFGSCGGCTLQHQDDASYRRVKLETLHIALEREPRTFAEVDQFVAEPFTVAHPRRENEDRWARRA
jgi:23S rRNA (uracil1939-C5)-methyltransferase